MTWKFNISKRIAVGYIFILFIAGVAGVVSIVRLQHNRNKYKEISKVYMPSIAYLKDFQVLTREANRLTINWVHISDLQEKERLRVIHAQDYPDLKFRMNHIPGVSENSELFREQTEIIRQYDSIISLQTQIMARLSTPADYTNDTLVDAALNILDTQIKPLFNTNQLYLKNVLDNETASLNELASDLDDSFRYLSATMIGMLVLMLIIGVVASYVATSSIVRPIKKLKHIITTLSQGEIPEVYTTTRSDEIGDMTNAIVTMTKSIQVKTDFARETGKGNYNAEFKLLSDKDILGLALVQMRDNLSLNAQKAADKSWTRVGIAKINEILAADVGTPSVMFRNIMNYLCEYVEAGSGALYLLKDSDKKDIHLELASGYAMGKNMVKVNRLSLGESLAGQAALDKKIINLKNAPRGFIKISSGLGESSPKQILVVPLLYENNVKGVIELASIHPFTSLHIEFLERAAVIIANAIDKVDRNAMMEHLLSESHKLNEKLRLSEADLKTANDELSTFVYRASHDLRGPLMSILGLVNISKADEEVSEHKNNAHYMQMVGEAASKLDRILTVLIKVMSIKEEVLHIEHINFRHMLNGIVENIKKQSNAQRTRFTIDIEADEPFFSDPSILGYALNNVIDNAVKFQNNALPESFVLIGVYSDNNGIRINVSDNGVGVKKGVQGKLFEMFFKGNAKTEGSGLGLYAVKKVIVKLGGRIEFSSQEGTGSFLSIFLPSLKDKMQGAEYSKQLSA